MSAALTGQWQALIERPLAFVREHWLAECLKRDLDAATLVALRDSSRFSARVEQLLTGYFQLQPLAQLARPAQEDLAVLLLADDDFSRLPRLCGAVWHAATLSREIRGDVVSEYRQLLGDDVFSLALAQRQLAGAANLLRTPVELTQAIDRDGAACLAAWLHAQPAELQAWLRLRLEVAELQQAHDERQVNVVRTVARLLTGSDDHE
ncbi:type III secretion protein [Pseudomonas syringae]|uniref:type III secretion protein n=1 Tax=Pseudomonas syringae TaxID=317 RepID=UPI003F751F36